MGVISSMVAERDFAGRREALALVVSVSGQHSIPALAATLRVGRPAEKRQALHYLADRKNVGAGVPSALAAVAEGLVEALAHRDLTVRTRAAEILSRLSQSGRIDISRTLVYLLRTGDVDLRRMAADLARSVTDGKAELWPKLVHFLRDEDWWVRERVVDALIELAGRDLAPLLSEFVSDPSDVVRRFAVEVLARLNDPDATDLLVRTAMLDADWWVRE